MKGIVNMDKYVELEHLADELESITSRLRKLIQMENNLEIGVKMNVVASVRFPEDASVNGIRETTESPKMPYLLKEHPLESTRNYVVR